MPAELLRNRDQCGRLTSMCLTPSLLSKKECVYLEFLGIAALRAKGGSRDEELPRNALPSVVPACTRDWDPLYHGSTREQLIHRFSFPENANFLVQNW